MGFGLSKPTKIPVECYHKRFQRQIKKKGAPNVLSSLPSDAFERVTRYLDAADIYRLSRVSRSLWRLAMTDPLWRKPTQVVGTCAICARMKYELPLAHFRMFSRQMLSAPGQQDISLFPLGAFGVGSAPENSPAFMLSAFLLRYGHETDLLELWQSPVGVEAAMGLLVYYAHLVAVKGQEPRSAIAHVRSLLAEARRGPSRRLLVERYTIDSHAHEPRDLCEFLEAAVRLPEEVGDTWTMMGPHISHWVAVCKRCERMRRGLKAARWVVGAGLCDQCYENDAGEGRRMPHQAYLGRVRRERNQLLLPPALPEQRMQHADPASAVGAATAAAGGAASPQVGIADILPPSTNPGSS